MTPKPSLAARLLLALVRAYQLLLSPWLGGHCRFEPSCSRYAASCIELHGAGRGGLLSIVRLCKCHPFHPGGFDPPPAPRIPPNRTPKLTHLERNLRPTLPS
jgi:putative membrane protein insertion efficiency factor